MIRSELRARKVLGLLACRGGDLVHDCEIAVAFHIRPKFVRQEISKARRYLPHGYSVERIFRLGYVWRRSVPAFPIPTPEIVMCDAGLRA